jgi:hypothetical protein
MYAQGGMTIRMGHSAEIGVGKGRTSSGMPEGSMSSDGVVVSCFCFRCFFFFSSSALSLSSLLAPPCDHEERALKVSSSRPLVVFQECRVPLQFDRRRKLGDPLFSFRLCTGEQALVRLAPSLHQFLTPNKHRGKRTVDEALNWKVRSSVTTLNVASFSRSTAKMSQMSITLTGNASRDVSYTFRCVWVTTTRSRKRERESSLDKLSMGGSAHPHAQELVVGEDERSRDPLYWTLLLHLAQPDDLRIVIL